MPDVIKSYLVSLGFKVDEPSLRRFETALDEAGKVAVETTSGVVKEILKWQTAITGGFAAISAGIIGVVSSVADADEAYRVFGEQQMLTKRRAEVVKRALDDMHATMADLPLIMVDPERAKRFKDLTDNIESLMQGRGPDFDENMKKWRGLTTEVTKLFDALEELKKEFVSDMIRRFGPQIEEVARQFHDWILDLKTNMPHIIDMFADFFIPILKDTWDIFLGLVDVAKNFLILFTNVVAVVSQDSSLKTATLDWEKLARAIDHVATGLRNVLLMMSGTETGMSNILRGNLNPSSEWFKFKRGFGDDWFPKSNETQTPGGGGSDAASRAFQLALRVGKQTGVDPRLIFEQWAHETGGFTSNVFKSLNNMGGIKMSGTDVYRKFGSLDEFADNYASQINRNWPGLRNAHSEADFAAELNRGRLGKYFTDDPKNYIGGMERMGRQFAGTISNSVTVNVGGTEASALDISRAVDDAMHKQNMWVLSQLQQGSF